MKEYWYMRCLDQINLVVKYIGKWIYSLDVVGSVNKLCQFLLGLSCCTYM